MRSGVSSVSSGVSVPSGRAYGARPPGVANAPSSAGACARLRPKRAPGRRASAAPPASAFQAALPNVEMNSRSFNGYGACQAEESVALIDQRGLGAWNDGQGFYNSRDSQWAGWSADGGVTWTPVAIPHPPGAQI